MKRLLTISMLAFIWAGGISFAHPVFAQSEGETAFLFGYYPKEGQQDLFNKGYRRHIDWHREQNDPLVWYGWYVSFGDRLGLFIDGTFGTTPAALDASTDAAADVANFAQTTAPYADPAFRRAYVLQRDLSTGTPLENSEPSQQMQVYFFELQPGTARAFERVVQTLQSAQELSDEVSVHTWYELVNGGVHPTYMLIVPREVWGGYGDANGALASVFAQNLDPDEADDLLSILRQAVKRIRSEQWSYRSDLSYFPDSH